jgi:hypothetical protein
VKVAADITVTDGTNALTLNVNRFWYNLQRTPKAFSLKSLPGLGAPTAYITDFGSYLEHFGFVGWMTSREDSNKLHDYSHDEWFVNRGTGLTVTIGALSAYDDDQIALKSGNLQPLVTYCRTGSDVEIDGVEMHPFELRMAVARRL